MRSRGRRHVALVAPFFARELRGRKERFAFAYATHLALEGVALEVLTTTAISNAPDANFFHAGTDHTEPFLIHRFAVHAPDRVAFGEAMLLAGHGGRTATDVGTALLDERVRSPDLLAHVRLSADRYDAFLFLDITVPTTVHSLPDVVEKALLVPLLDAEPVTRLPAVVECVSGARMILCTTETEAGMLSELFGPGPRARTRIVGMGVDTVPAPDLRRDRVARLTNAQPYVLDVGDDDHAAASMAESGTTIVRLNQVDERDRAPFFAFARAIAVSGKGLGFVPEVLEAWAYQKAVLAAADAPGAAALVRETGGGLVVDPDGWRDAIASLPSDEALSMLAREGAAYVETRGGWRRVAARTSEAIDALAAVEDGRSREALLAQVAYLYPVVQRQRRTIEAMRVSRFWRLRDAWFAMRRRIGIGPADDPVGAPSSEDGAAERAALGDPYQLFREHHRLRGEDVERMRRVARFLPRPVSFSVVVDAREGRSDGLNVTLRSLRDQVYEKWSAIVLVNRPLDATDENSFGPLGSDDPRIAIAHGGADRLGDGDFVGVLEPHDRLEPHALFEFALALQDDADVVYSDEDRLDDRGLVSTPWFKPDWSPETLLTRDYVGRFCAMRREPLERCGGVRDVFETARWYEALLRLTEQTDRVVHVPQVLCHRYVDNRVRLADQALAVEVALQRRGEKASVQAVAAGIDVRFAAGDERVCVVVPTRDRTDLLGPCIASLFERTAYPNFEVVVVDNGSREPATMQLLAEWQEREPDRFRVIADPSPFNFSRLNNKAVRSTDASFVVLLNNDTEIVSPDWMVSMLGQARRPAIGAVGALLLYDDETVQHGGIVLGILGLAGHAHRFLPASASGYHGALQLDTNYLAVTGACLMVEKRKYEAVEGLDEGLAVSYNDVDLCLKLHRAGYRNVFVPHALLHHYESKSRGGDDTPAKVARAVEEVETIRKRWPEWAVRDPYYNPNLTVDAEDFGLRL